MPGGAALGLGEGFEAAGVVEDLSLQGTEAKLLESGVHRDDRPFPGRGVREGTLVWGGGLVVPLDDLGAVAVFGRQLQGLFTIEGVGSAVRGCGVAAG